jgi:hypothetical protein
MRGVSVSYPGITRLPPRLFRDLTVPGDGVRWVAGPVPTAGTAERPAGARYGALATSGNHLPVDAFNDANIRQRIEMPFKPSGGATHPADRAMSRDTSWAVGPPDILLMVLAALSLWALIVWAISGYL